MEIPKKLKILSHEYIVKEVDGMIDSGNHNTEGVPTILISKRLNQTQKEVTLIHEIIHAINGEIIEKDVEFLAQTIYQVLKENNLLK